MNLESSILSEMLEREKYCKISLYIRNVKHKKNEQAYRYREQMDGCQRRECDEVKAK